jgi:hypothetical protein
MTPVTKPQGRGRIISTELISALPTRHRLILGWPTHRLAEVLAVLAVEQKAMGSLLLRDGAVSMKIIVYHVYFILSL